MEQGTSGDTNHMGAHAHMQLDSARSSWAGSSIQSKRSTQASFASSRTSYCSGFSRASSICSGLPPSHLEARYNGPNGSHPPKSAYIEPARQSLTTRLQKAVPETIQARCPWCAATFTRRHDFKKHAREFHLSRVFWQCRNTKCRERTGSERQAKMHPNRVGSVGCKNLGSSKTILQCDKKHFGCPHCAQYFGDAEVYLMHLAKECTPGKAPRSPHQSLQIRALLRQPELISYVENYCLSLRGDSDAYKRLWWAWDKTKMANIIERLEYGVQGHVGNQHPGIALSELNTFLQDMLAPSPYSLFESEIRKCYTPQASPAASQKPLPPLPHEEQPPATQSQYHQDSVFQQARSYLQPLSDYVSEAPGYSHPPSVEAWRHQQPLRHDPMIAGSFFDGTPRLGDFEWNDLADEIYIDPRQSSSFQ